MMHAYRESPLLVGICSACGLYRDDCQGAKPLDLSFLKTKPEYAGRLNSETGFTPASDWEKWCRRYGIDPNTPDERLLDDYLHGRVPSRAQQWVTPQIADVIERMKARYDLMAKWHAEANAQWHQDFQVDLKFRDAEQERYYAGLDAYDAACARMPKPTRDLQARMEVVEIERWLTLP